MSGPTHPPPGYPPPPQGPGYYAPGSPPPPSRGKKTAVILGIVATVVLLGLAVLIPVLVVGGDDDETESSATASETSDPSEDDQPTEDVEANLDELTKHDDLETTHVDDAVTYDQSPPVGGPHAPEWLDCGAYDEPVRLENVVHDLEHGTVWITYEPGLDAESITALESVLPQNGILSPYDGLQSPVVATVWGRQLELTGADDPRLPLFIDKFRDGQTSPEPFASCAGGIPDAAGSGGAAGV